MSPYFTSRIVIDSLKNCNYLTIKRLFASTKFEINMVSEIEKRLDIGEIKHRTHPGVRKTSPTLLPSFVQDAIYRIVSYHSEKIIRQNAVKLCHTLACRQLPVEMHEVENKFYEASLELDDIGKEHDIPEAVTKKAMLELKKQIQADMGRWKRIDYNKSESVTYLVGRAAPNYASTLRILKEVIQKIPSFQPKTIFDFGSGIGSVVWAANSLWRDVEEYYCVDSSSEMNDLSQELLTEENSEEMLIKNIRYRQFLPASDSIKFDLVVSSFSLLDSPSATERLKVIDTLWRKTNDILVVIEYGNLVGFSTVLDARDYILHIENNIDDNLNPNKTGAHIVCPCPHDLSCPIVQHTRKPCKLGVTYQTLFPRQRLQLKKDWISYVVLRKGPRPDNESNWPRIIQPVLKKARHAYCQFCCRDGQIHDVIVTRSRHGKNVYRATKSSSLGDMLPVHIKVAKDDAEYPDDVSVENIVYEDDDKEK